MIILKLVIAIVNNDDSASVAAGLTTAGYFITKLSTTGGFLQAGNTTFLIGAEDTGVEGVKSVIRQYSSTRVKDVPTRASFGRGISPADVKVQTPVSGATVFVVDVESLDKL